MLCVKLVYSPSSHSRITFALSESSSHPLIRRLACVNMISVVDPRPTAPNDGLLDFAALKVNAAAHLVCFVC
jgi:hypothetical protein